MFLCSSERWSHYPCVIYQHVHFRIGFHNLVGKNLDAFKTLKIQIYVFAVTIDVVLSFFATVFVSAGKNNQGSFQRKNSGYFKTNTRVGTAYNYDFIFDSIGVFQFKMFHVAPIKFSVLDISIA